MPNLSERVVEAVEPNGGGGSALNWSEEVRNQGVVPEASRRHLLAGTLGVQNPPAVPRAVHRGVRIVEMVGNARRDNLRADGATIARPQRTTVLAGTSVWLGVSSPGTPARCGDR